MSWGSALIMLVTGILLPTGDVYSDVFFVFWLFKGNYSADRCYSTIVPPHPKFGAVMLTPLLLSWILVARQWFYTERGLKQKLITLPLLILQVYPQWRALRVLYFAKWKKKGGWEKMKEEWETGITHIGKYVVNGEIMFWKLFSSCFRGLFGICTSGTHFACDLADERRSWDLWSTSPLW